MNIELNLFNEIIFSVCNINQDMVMPRLSTVYYPRKSAMPMQRINLVWFHYIMLQSMEIPR